jgi:hypothetical protein
MNPRTRRFALSTVLSSLALIPALAFQSKESMLFDGRSFNGWEGNMKFFRLEQNAIVGGMMTAPIPRNEFLCTKKEYSDFVLRLKVKLQGDPAKANAGIQIRSKRIPNDSEVIGYQADMGQHYWGALYDESRRKKVLAQPNPEELAKHLKREDWNDYEIRADGKRIVLTLNGYQTVDYTEAEEGIAQSGCICLQIHAGPASEVRYRDIRIEPLGAKP